MYNIYTTMFLCFIYKIVHLKKNSGVKYYYVAEGMTSDEI